MEPDEYFDLAHFCGIKDEKWLEHLSKNNYACGCTFEGRVFKGDIDKYGVCDKWYVYKNLEKYEKSYKKAKEDYEKAKKLVEEMESQ